MKSIDELINKEDEIKKEAYIKLGVVPMLKARTRFLKLYDQKNPPPNVTTHMKGYRIQEHAYYEQRVKEFERYMSINYFQKVKNNV